VTQNASMPLRNGKTTRLISHDLQVGPMAWSRKSAIFGGRCVTGFGHAGREAGQTDLVASLGDLESYIYLRYCGEAITAAIERALPCSDAPTAMLPALRILGRPNRPIVEEATIPARDGGFQSNGSAYSLGSLSLPWSRWCLGLGWSCLSVDRRGLPEEVHAQLCSCCDVGHQAPAVSH
jgi:hypothetical protein